MDVDYSGQSDYSGHLSRQYQPPQQHYQPQQQPSSSIKPPDYVYFNRTTEEFREEVVSRAKTAQLKLEHFYKAAVDSAIERNTR
jgi:hypothetical protein